MDLNDFVIEPQKPWAQTKKQPKIADALGYSPVIVFCIPGRQFSSAFLDCWTRTVGWCFNESIKFVFSNGYSSMIHYARSKCLGANVLNGKNQKPFNDEIAYTHLMWIDSDMFWNPEQIGSLLLRKEKVVSGLYSHGQDGNFTVFKNCNDDYFIKNGSYELMKRDEVKDKTDLIEIDYAGLGFMLIAKGVVESLEYPWFTSMEKEIGNNIKDLSSEDATFCFRIKEQGFKIFVDPTIIVGHEKTIFV